MKTPLEKIPSLRSLNQQLTNPKFKTAKEIAGWIGALQAQDYSMSKWALGIRLKNSTEVAINKEINSGSIIRTHLLRPTWHFVSSNDIYWILELTAPRIKAAVKFRDKQLGLTDPVFDKCNRILEKSLRDYNHKTREELITELKKNKIDIEENRASHIFLRAEMEGIICSGKQKNEKPTYAVLEEWVPEHKKTNRDEALRELAKRYFTSHGPASIHDFHWWSGLSMSDVKLSLDYNKDNLITEIIQNKTYWMANDYIKPKPDFNEINLLPAYDEFLISYRDRTATLSLIENKKVISNNGLFYPTILQNGHVIGTWKRNVKNDTVFVTINLFKPDNLYLGDMLTKSLTRYSNFINKKIELI